jgi:LPXTG-site transpeptidase (sortase) family protein
MQFIAQFLVIMLLAPFFILNLVNASRFSDVMMGYKYSTSIEKMADLGIVHGYPDRSFRPEKTINRAESTKILIGSRFSQNLILSALDDHRARGHHYVNLPDVSVNAWYAPFVEIAYQYNIAKGSRGVFRPGDSMNLAEGLKMIINTYGGKIGSSPLHDSNLLAVPQGEWYSAYFNYAYDKNLINRQKFYHPGQLITRGEFIEIVYRLQVVKADELAMFPVNNLLMSNEYTVTIPRLNIINQPVGLSNPYNNKQGLEILRTFPLGHYFGTPDSEQKFVLYGHSSGFAWDRSPYKVVLRQIDHLRSGDMIYINFKEVGYAFRVARHEIINADQDKNILHNMLNNQMALYTCWPPDSVKQRYVIYAESV